MTLIQSLTAYLEKSPPPSNIPALRSNGIARKCVETNSPEIGGHRLNDDLRETKISVHSSPTPFQHKHVTRSQTFLPHTLIPSHRAAVLWDYSGNTSCKCRPKDNPTRIILPAQLPNLLSHPSRLPSTIN